MEPIDVIILISAILLVGGVIAWKIVGRSRGQIGCSDCSSCSKCVGCPSAQKAKSPRYVLITGAYGGMGRAAVTAFQKEGYCVFALDKKVGEAEENVVPIEYDATDVESVKRAFSLVKSHTDVLDAIVHFAGIYTLNSLVEIGEEEFKRIFDVNVFGVYRINKAFLPLLRRGSRIVVTTSELAPLDPLPFTGLYAVAKSALDKYAYSLRMELQLLGIFVSVLRPGAVETELLNVSTRALDAFCDETKLYSR